MQKGTTAYYWQINRAVLDSYLACVEAGYAKYDNPYHNAVHAADVTQTMYWYLHSAGLEVCMPTGGTGTELKGMVVRCSAA